MDLISGKMRPGCSAPTDIHRNAQRHDTPRAMGLTRPSSARRLGQGCRSGCGLGIHCRCSGVADTLQRHLSRLPAVQHCRTGLRPACTRRRALPPGRNELDRAIASGHAAVGGERAHQLPALLRHRLCERAVAHPGLARGRQRNAGGRCPLSRSRRSLRSQAPVPRLTHAQARLHRCIGRTSTFPGSGDSTRCITPAARWTGWPGRASIVWKSC